MHEWNTRTFNLDSQYKVQTEILSLNCHFLSLLGNTRLRRSCKRSIQSPDVIKIGSRCPVTLDTLVSLSNLWQEFLSLCSGAWSPKVHSKRGSEGIATPGFPNLNCELGGDIHPALVYLVQNTKILRKLAESCQVNAEAHLGTPDVHLLKA